MKSTKQWKVGRTMQKQVGIGKQDFAALRESQCFYIDKTDFIRQWWNYRDDVTLITRPRRFGKTLNMSMLNCFFSNKYADRGDLFEGIDTSWNRVENGNAIGQLISSIINKYDFKNPSASIPDLVKAYQMIQNFFCFHIFMGINQ